jgi:Tfp pilus assembly protein FimV
MKKTLFLSALAVVALGYGVHAGEGKKCSLTGDCDAQKAHVETRVAEMKKELGLNAKQEAKVKATLEASMEKKCAILKESSEKISAVKESTSAELKGILTPAQQAKWDESMKKGADCCPLAGQKGHVCPVADKKAPCCPKAGVEGHQCPVKEKADACCPLTGEKMKK